MRIIETIFVAFSMFSAIPVPQKVWNEQNMRYALCAFPLVGVVIGVVCWGWTSLCQQMGLSELLQGAGLCVIPVLITGGIHLDGYADTWDALSSHAPVEKKHEILKDPNMGVFAGIHLCCYFVVSFALWASLPQRSELMVLLGFCLSRSLSGFAVASFPLAKDTGLAHTFASAADKKRVRVILLLISFGLCISLCLCGWNGIFMVMAALVSFFVYYQMAVKEFGGLSGDLAGWFLQTTELWMLSILVLSEYIEVRL